MAVPTGRSRRRIRALRRVRTELGSAEVLLGLARSLAGVTTSPEAAQRIAEAIPAVTGCDQACVLLPGDDGRLSVQGVAGSTDERTQEALTLPIDGLPATLITTLDDAPPEARAAMETLGIGALGLMAVEVRG